MEPERALWAAVLLAYLTDVKRPTNYQAQPDALNDWQGSKRVFRRLAMLAGYDDDAAIEAADDWINQERKER